MELLHAVFHYLFDQAPVQCYLFVPFVCLTRFLYFVSLLCCVVCLTGSDYVSGQWRLRANSKRPDCAHQNTAHLPEARSYRQYHWEKSRSCASITESLYSSKLHLVSYDYEGQSRSYSVHFSISADWFVEEFILCRCDDKTAMVRTFDSSRY